MKIVKTIAVLLAATFVLMGCGSSPKAAQPDELDLSIREASDYLNSRVKQGSKAVFLNISSTYPDLSRYILDILSENAVNDGVFSVVDRQQLDAIREELKFQYSGEVSDKSAQEIGQMLGAQTIVSGTVGKIGALYRLQVKAIEVQSAAIQGQWSRNVPDGPTVAALTQNVSTSSVASASSSRPASGTAQVASAQPATQTVQTKQEIPESDLIGVWKGSYTAGQGETALILTVYEEHGSCVAIFDFYNLPGKSNAREGKYYMDVSYNKQREKFYLKGTKWIENPGGGYNFADLEGTIARNIFSGYISGSSNTFRVIKQTN